MVRQAHHERSSSKPCILSVVDYEIVDYETFLSIALNTALGLVPALGTLT
jgi:hypothetical protein